MVRFAHTALALLVLLISLRPTFGAPCSFLGDPINLNDGQFFYRGQGAKTWSELPQAGASLGGQTVEFAYVVRESLFRPRHGAVMFKSGRVSEDAALLPQKVKLSRSLKDADTICSGVREFDAAEVSAKSYDDYHLSFKPQEPDRSTLKKFHFQYYNYEGCRRSTDSVAPDSRTPNDRRTNRTQFSFDRNVVLKGVDQNQAALFGERQIAALFGSAVAAPEPLRYAERKVQLYAYSTSAGMPACFKFTLEVPANRGFIRVNDLEGFKTENDMSRRIDEPEWTISP